MGLQGAAQSAVLGAGLMGTNWAFLSGPLGVWFGGKSTPPYGAGFTWHCVSVTRKGGGRVQALVVLCGGAIGGVL